MPVPADDDVIMNLDTEAARDLNDPFRHFSISARDDVGSPPG
jgi:hypothetical protein